ncbi:hypothetical protein ABIC64_003363 [Plantibacter flavus]
MDATLRPVDDDGARLYSRAPLCKHHAGAAGR